MGLEKGPLVAKLEAKLQISAPDLKPNILALQSSTKLSGDYDSASNTFMSLTVGVVETVKAGQIPPSKPSPELLLTKGTA